MTVLIDGIAALRGTLRPLRDAGPIGLVPTMGALHAGHARLLEQARRECRTVVASIFVNPLQFDRDDDLKRYPRTIESDLELCATGGVDFVFAPAPAEMYPAPPKCTVDVGVLGDHLCGQHRPGHFRGVATVVLKLLNMAAPDVAYFGQKDGQQLAVIRRMVHDLDVPVRIEAVETVREPDGLALSSRNVRLRGEDRERALALHAALRAAGDTVAGGTRDTRTVVAAARAAMSPYAVDPEYLAVVDADTFTELGEIDRRALITVAARVGDVRLIDNHPLTPNGSVS